MHKVIQLFLKKNNKSVLGALFNHNKKDESKNKNKNEIAETSTNIELFGLNNSNSLFWNNINKGGLYSQMIYIK